MTTSGGANFLVIAVPIGQGDKSRAQLTGHAAPYIARVEPTVAISSTPRTSSHSSGRLLWNVGDGIFLVPFEREIGPIFRIGLEGRLQSP